MTSIFGKATRTVQLRRLGRLRYGDALPDAAREVGDVPVYASGGAVGHHREANTRGPVIVIGRKGSYGSVHWSSEPAFVIDTAYSLDHVAEGGDLRWFFYVLSVADLRSLSQDVGVPGLSRERVHELRVPLLDARDQRLIADFLDRECARIADLEHHLGTLADSLREQESAVIETWLQKTRNDSEPRKLAWDATLPRGFAFKSEEFVHDSDSGVRLLRGTNVTPAGTRWKDVVYWPHERRAEASRFELRAGDLVVGLNRPWVKNGLRTAIISEEDLPALMFSEWAASGLLDLAWTCR